MKRGGVTRRKTLFSQRAGGWLAFFRRRERGNVRERLYERCESGVERFGSKGREESGEDSSVINMEVECMERRFDVELGES